MEYWKKRFYILFFISLFSILGLGAVIENQYDLSLAFKAETSRNLAMLSQGLSLLQERSRQLHDEPIYDWPIHLDDFDRMTSEFGYRVLYNPFTGGSEDSEHKGIDLVGTHHARVTAVSDGVVVENYPPPNGFFKGHPVLGGMIKIKHTDGTYSVYGHLSVTYVSEYGSRKYVSAGDVIGRTGNTGMSYGEHLHFELRNTNDEAIQSLFYLKNPL